jgi:RNA recognition motif-containing protein
VTESQFCAKGLPPRCPQQENSMAQAPRIHAAYRLFVGNLSPQIQEEQLRAMLARFGAVTNVHVVMAISTGKPLGFAFVEMDDEQAAARAIAGLNGTPVDGRCLKVRIGF